jgi:N-acetylglucosamine transport system permease protein
VRHGRYRFVAEFLVLPVILYAIFVVSPYVQTVIYSFTDWRGVSSRVSFIGLGNYRALLHDDVFWTALQHNATMLVVLPFATIVVALFFSFMLNIGRQGEGGSIGGVRGSAFYRVVYFFPQVLSVAILAVLWQAVYRTDQGGLINGLLMKLGVISTDHPYLFLSSHSATLWCVIFVIFWSSVGFYVVLFSAAMQAIPRDFYEAALLDGAGRFVTFRRLTIPLLWDQIQVAWVFLAIAAMDGFALVYTMTPATAGGGGGPDHQSEVIATHLYRNGFVFGRTGYACAIGVVLFLLTLILSMISLRLSRKERIEL